MILLKKTVVGAALLAICFALLGLYIFAVFATFKVLSAAGVPVWIAGLVPTLVYTVATTIALDQLEKQAKRFVLFWIV